MWILYSFLAAVSHASVNATSKKALGRKGIVNFVGFGIYIVSGIIFCLFLLVKTGKIYPQISNTSLFWVAILSTALLETISMFFQYKALEIADLTYLMPFFSLTAIFVIIPSFFILGEFPSFAGFLGITIIVAGAIIMNFKNKGKLTIEQIEEKIKEENNRKGLMYFLIAMVVASFIPITLKVSVLESSVLFTSFMVSVLVGISFLVMLFVIDKREKIREALVLSEKKNIILLTAIILSGIITTIEFASMNKAFSLADVSYVMAIKRTMPFFASNTYQR